jgi:hypothetical protein
MINELFWLIYIAGILNGVINFLNIVGWGLVILGGFSIVPIIAWKFDEPTRYSYDNNEIWEEKIQRKEKNIKNIFRIIKTTLAVGVVACILAVLLPSQKTFVAMIAGGAVQEVVTSDKAKEIGGKSLDLLNKWLDEKLEKDIPKKQNTPSEPETTDQRKI